MFNLCKTALNFPSGIDVFYPSKNLTWRYSLYIQEKKFRRLLIIYN